MVAISATARPGAAFKAFRRLVERPKHIRGIPMQARELMSTKLVVVPPETPVAALADLLAARGISAVPVVDATGAPVGYR